MAATMDSATNTSSIYMRSDHDAGTPNPLPNQVISMVANGGNPKHQHDFTGRTYQRGGHQRRPDHTDMEQIDPVPASQSHLVRVVQNHENTERHRNPGGNVSAVDTDCD